MPFTIDQLDHIGRLCREYLSQPPVDMDDEETSSLFSGAPEFVMSSDINTVPLSPENDTEPIDAWAEYEMNTRFSRLRH